MDFKLNFSYLKAPFLQEDKITIGEITEVYKGDLKHTVWDAIPQYSQHGSYYYLIGFSPQKRFIQIIVNCDGSEIYFLDVKVAGLEEIAMDFFKNPL